MSESKLKELDGICGCLLVFWRLVHDNVAGCDHGPSALEALEVWLNCLAVCSNHLGPAEIVALSVGVFHIADAAVGLHHVAGYTVVALGADSTANPLNDLTSAEILLPVCVGFAEEACEVPGGARTITATDLDDW